MRGLDSLMQTARPPSSLPLRVPHMRRECGPERMRVVRRLGQGSSGTVYEASDRGQPVALKVLDAVGTAHVRSFRREFELLTRCLHPNIVQAREFFEADAHCSFSMELIRGSQMDIHWLMQCARTACESPPGRARRRRHSCGARRELLLRNLMRQIVEGVAAMHRWGIVHRDLKPNNILIDGSGRAVIVDFGLAQRMACCRRKGRSVRAAGTPAYLAPEQILGQPATAQVDAYALGVILYQLLSGKLPHAECDVTAMLHAKLNSEPLTLSTVVPTIAPDLEHLCHALLRRDPAERPDDDALLRCVRAWQLPRTAPEPRPDDYDVPPAYPVATACMC